MTNALAQTTNDLHFLWPSVADSAAAGDVLLDAGAADAAVRRLAETLVAGTRFVDMPLYRLTGINAGKGCIRQFVAMPLGKGYTIEEQVTGEANFGGMQIRVVPAKLGMLECEAVDVPVRTRRRLLERRRKSLLIRRLLGTQGVAQLAEAGVKRISFATSLYRAAMTGLIQAASEIKEKGTFGFVDQAIITADLNKYFPD